MNRSYWPDVEATGQLLTELCESLSTSFEVQFFAGKPNEVLDAAGSHWQKSGARNGFRINRVDHWQLPKQRMSFKGLNDLPFVRSNRRVLKSDDSPSVVVLERDPLLLSLEAPRLQRRTGCKKSDPGDLKRMSENARKLAVTRFTCEVSVEKFSSILKNVIQGSIVAGFV